MFTRIRKMGIRIFFAVTVIVCFLRFTEKEATAWDTGFKYIQTIQYNYTSGKLHMINVGFASSYKAPSASYWVTIKTDAGSNGDLLEFEDIMHLISQLERMRMENMKVYLQSYSDRYSGNTPWLAPNDFFRGNY